MAAHGRTEPPWLTDDRQYICPVANLATHELRLALEFLSGLLDALTTRRAVALLADHRRVREAARDVGHYSVRSSLPVNVLRVYVLLPDAL